MCRLNFFDLITYILYFVTLHTHTVFILIYIWTYINWFLHIKNVISTERKQFSCCFCPPFEPFTLHYHETLIDHTVSYKFLPAYVYKLATYYLSACAKKSNFEQYFRILSRKMCWCALKAQSSNRRTLLHRNPFLGEWNLTLLIEFSSVAVATAGGDDD